MLRFKMLLMGKGINLQGNRDALSGVPDRSTSRQGRRRVIEDLELVQ